jgi:uncharacterized membrane protein YqhA
VLIHITFVLSAFLMGYLEKLKQWTSYYF